MSPKKKSDDQSVAHLSMPVPLNRHTTATEIRPAEEKDSKFSFPNIFQLVTFWKSAEDGNDTSKIVPQQLVQLRNLINLVATRSSELNVNDNPDLTRQF